MDLSSQLLLKRPINIKVVVTPRWKEEVQKQLQNQINRWDGQLQQIETQGQRAIAEVQKQITDPNDPTINQQVGNIQGQVNRRKSEILEKKNQALQQLQQVQLLEMEQEVGQGQLESFFTVQKGDNLVQKMQVEILLRDGVIEDIRGEL
ncbi:MAG: YlqD family protein [Synechococcales bacterium]|nr:YlqD family protein [Synechococcales bacterium]